jgi:uncharacterized protein
LRAAQGPRYLERRRTTEPDERFETDPMTARNQPSAPFWRVKTLDEMSVGEWESLCDGCGRCCLVKLEDEDDGKIHFTDIGCRLLDAKTCHCLDYRQRHRRVPDCVKLTPAAVRELSWLPVTCAYRLVSEGRDLFDWHPLVSGSPDSVHEAGVSVRGRVSASETDLAPEHWPDRIVTWPNRTPRANRGSPTKPIARRPR